MAMYGWIASSPGFDTKIDNPQTLGLLKKFSNSNGKPAFRFDLGDVVDTHNDAGSYDHTVWIEIADKATGQKVGEISTDISDKHVGIMDSEHILLAASLDRLGFLDEEELANDGGSLEAPAEDPLEAPAEGSFEASAENPLEAPGRLQMASLIVRTVNHLGSKLEIHTAAHVACLDAFIKNGNKFNF